MKKTFTILSLAVVNLMLIAGLLKADVQSNSIVICGKVLYKNTVKPVNKAVVKLYKINDNLISYKVIETTIANEAGEYSFTSTQITPDTKIRIGAAINDILVNDKIEIENGNMVTDEVEIGAYANDLTVDKINLISEIYTKTVPVDLTGAGIKTVTLYIQGEAQLDEYGGGIGTYPKEPIINQNYPNPFNPTTNITYGVPEQLHVSLKIYDLSGKVVAELVNETKSRGYYTVKFDASNLSSGFYISILKVGDFTATKKMSLIK